MHTATAKGPLHMRHQGRRHSLQEGSLEVAQACMAVKADSDIGNTDVIPVKILACLFGCIKERVLAVFLFPSSGDTQMYAHL